MLWDLFRSKVSVRGRNNSVEWIGKPSRKPKRLKVSGANNTLIFEEGVNLEAFFINIKGDGNTVRIGKGANIRGVAYIRGNNCSLTIGENTTSAFTRFSIGNERSIAVGKDCMFSRNVEIRCWDEHPIYDSRTQKQINTGRDIRIEDRVWLGEGVSVTKGATIASGSVIGLGSIVTKPLLEQNCVYAGIPAKHIRSGVAWFRSPHDAQWTEKPQAAETVPLLKVSY